MANKHHLIQIHIFYKKNVCKKNPQNPKTLLRKRSGNLQPQMPEPQL